MRRVFFVYVLVIVLLALLACDKKPTDSDGNIPPAPVTLYEPWNVTGLSVTLSWSLNMDEDFAAYRIYYSTESDVIEEDNLGAEVASQTHASATITGLEQQTLYYFRVFVTDSSGLSSGSNVVNETIPEVTHIIFPDPNFETLIREVLNKSTGDIAPEDMLAITDLYGWERNITDITGIEYCSNLTWLHLGWNDITDISPLSGLANLTELSLWGNQIVEISPLYGLANLTELALLWNDIADISPLSSMTNLTRLWLRSNHLTDISPLSGLTNLTRLSLSDNQIADISSLSDLVNLTYLELLWNDIADLAPLSSLVSLTRLWLRSNRIADSSPLSSLTNLTTLDLGQNELADISPLSGLTNLTELYLPMNQIADISPVVQNTGISQGDYVDLGYNPLSTISINTYIPQLQARGVTVNY